MYFLNIIFQLVFSQSSVQETEVETTLGILSRKGFNKGYEVLANSLEELELPKSGRLYFTVTIAMIERSGLLPLHLLLPS